MMAMRLAFATVLLMLCVASCIFSTANEFDAAETTEDSATCTSSSTDCSRAPSGDAENKQKYSGSQRNVDFSAWQFAPVSSLQQLPMDDDERNIVRQVQHAVFSLVHPTPFKEQCRLAAVSPRALEDLLDINPETVWNDEFKNFAAGNVVKERSNPLSHRYGGHQFGDWAGQLGDGRAVLLGEFVNSKGKRWELQLKGSGKTPYSRRGDGRAVVRSSVREFLASEAMHHLHMPTSRAASLVICDDLIWRDQFYDGHPRQEKTAVVLRLAQSWFRIGSLEILANNGELDILRQVVDVVIETSFPHLKDLSEQDRYLGFFHTVVNGTAEMIARWLSVGFAHGVCNTDNFSLLSITIDYGPFGFLDNYDADFVPNTSDDEGLYRFQSQPQIGLFNLNKLRNAMDSLFSNSELSKSVLGTYHTAFHHKYLNIMRQKLGLAGVPNDDYDQRLLGRLFELMQVTKADFTMTFREMSEVSLEDIQNDKFPEEFWALPRISEHEDWRHWVEAYVNRSQTLRDYISEDERQRRMQAVNPRYILRNYMAQRATDKAEDSSDYSEINSLLKTLERPFERQEAAEMKGYASRPPRWATKLKVSCSS